MSQITVHKGLYLQNHVQCIFVCVCVCVYRKEKEARAKSCLTLATLWTVACLAPCYVLLQGIFPIQESNPGLQHYRQIFYQLSYAGSHIYIHTHIYIQLVYFWLCWIFGAAWAVSNFHEQGLLSSCGMWASHCGGFSCCIEHGLSSCVSWAQLLHDGLCDLPGLGIKPVSPTLAGGFFIMSYQGSLPM